jgi:hypothetical protein
VDVLEVVPGSPAERAGLRSACAILSVAGQRVTSPQELEKVLNRHRAGEIVEITYQDGSQVRASRAQLARGNTPLPTRREGRIPEKVTTPEAAPAAGAAVARFMVEHDHGASGTNFCIGWMTIGNGMIQFVSQTASPHSFEVPVSAVKEVERNPVYLAAIGAFHIRLKNGANYDFCAVNFLGQAQPPDAVLAAIDQAMGKN